MIDDKWMSCTSCHAIVQLNATGVCLGCQGGFAGQQEEDKYVSPEERQEPKKINRRVKKPKKRG